MEVIHLGRFVEKNKNGDTIEFDVQTAAPEMTEEIVEFMTKYFLPREPLSKIKIADEPLSLSGVQKCWRDLLSLRTTVVAMLNQGNEKSKLIGVNILTISRLNQKPNKKYDGAGFNDIIESFDFFSESVDVFGKYGVDCYLAGFGLTVDTDYTGFNIGLRILECRRPLCKELGVTATATIFSAPASQHLARKVGYEELAKEEYSTFTCNGKKLLETVPGCMIMMGLRF